MSNCLLCDYLYVPSDNEDKSKHIVEHNNRVQLIMDLKFIPMNIVDREAIKKLGYNLIFDKNNVNDDNIYLGALAVFVVHFDRSLWDAFDKGKWKNHPSFKEYISMALNNTHLKQDVPVNIWKGLLVILV